MLILLAVSLMAGSAMAAEIDVFGLTWSCAEPSLYTVNSPTSLTISPGGGDAGIWFAGDIAENSGLTLGVGDVISYDRYIVGTGPLPNPGYISRPLDSAGVFLTQTFEWTYRNVDPDPYVDIPWTWTMPSGWIGDVSPATLATGLHFEFVFDTATTHTATITDIVSGAVIASASGATFDGAETLADVAGWHIFSLNNQYNVTIENFVATPYTVTAAPEIVTLDSVVTVDTLLPADLSAVVTDVDNDVSSVSWEVLTDDWLYPAGAVASVTDTTVDLYAPAATFTTDTEGTYKVRLTVNDLGGNSVESIAQIDVYDDACQAAQAAPSWAVSGVYDADTDCDLDIFDFAQFALKWLDDINLAGQETYVEYREHFADNGGINAISSGNSGQAWHHDGKTYVAYQGDMNAPTITYYDHGKASAPGGVRWAPAVEAGVNPLGNTDTHGAPAMLIDKQGYIHVFYGSHTRRQMYSRSKRPYDITEWDAMPPVSPNMTYPNGAMLDNGTMVLIARQGGHVRPWVELTSSDGGNTWSEEWPIVDFRPHGLYGNVKPGADGNTVHFTWSLQAKGDLIVGTSYELLQNGAGGYADIVVDNRHHCFYMRRDQNGLWYNIQGEPLQTPVDLATAYEKCLVYRGDWPLHGQKGTMGIDTYDNPHIVFLLGEMPADQADWHTDNVDYTYKYARWDGNNWVLSDITTTDSIWDMGQAIFPKPDGSVDVYLGARGSVTDGGLRTTEGRIGGNIEQWRSEDQGMTWEKIKDVITFTAETDRLFNSPLEVVNAHPDGKVVFATWSTDAYFQQGDFTQFVYLYGDSGFCSRRYEDSRIQSMAEFQKLNRAEWNEVFHDPCTENWQDRWTLDGLKATVTNSEEGMDFNAGPVRMEDASHAVMWTKESFAGDIRLDYEYTRTDDVTEAVTILYLQATGSGAEGYDKDISMWSDERIVPAMATYFNHMHLLHISYAAFDIGNQDPQNDYIRARRYMPEAGGLANTELEPDYLRTGLFAKDVPHNITVIKKDDDFFMFVRNSDKEFLCHWKTDVFPPITEGRIGLRHMWTRAARYRDFRISQLD